MTKIPKGETLITRDELKAMLGEHRIRKLKPHIKGLQYIASDVQKFKRKEITEYPERYKDIVDLWNKGYTISEIAQILGTTRQNIHYKLKKLL